MSPSSAQPSSQQPPGGLGATAPPRRGAISAGPPILLLGAGCLPKLRALLDAPVGSERQPIVVIVPGAQRAAFEASVERGAWDDIDRHRVRFAFDDDPATVLDRAFPEWTPTSIHGATLVVGDPDLSAAEGRRWAEGFRAHHLAELAELATLRQRFIARAPHRSMPPRSLFGAVDASTTALQHLGRELAAAVTSLGVRAEFHAFDHQRDPFRPVRRLEALLRAAPDCLLSFVASRDRDWGALTAGIPTLSYWSSDPLRYPLDAMRFSSDDFVAVSSRRWIAHFAERGIEARHLPLASGLADPCRENPPDESRCDTILVVGHLPEPGDVLPPTLALHADALVSIAASGDSRPDASDHLADTDEERLLLRRGLAFARTGLERRAAAILLARAGLPLRIHGCERWRAAVAGTPAEGSWCGPLIDRAASAAAFRHAAAVVNVVSRAGVDELNMRVLDVAASAGVLISNDTPSLREALRLPHEALGYRSIEELPDIARALLDDPDRRAAIRIAARARAERDHGWQARWRVVFDWMSERSRATRCAAA